ncbi:EEF1A lysine methyltransferase 1 [Quaeritorhiza haematococci]|nr:EEF1A lysine methyltransferase 1 [Quaeritorhiza haematococci]
MDTDDDIPQLSSETLAALQEFLAEQQAAEQRMEKLRQQSASADAAGGSASDGVDGEVHEEVEEDAEIRIEDFGEDWHIKPTPNRKITLLEYDKRFDVFGRSYVFFDYSDPPETLNELNGTRPLKHQFDVVVADPPFLSEECLTKTAKTVRWLLKKGGDGTTADGQENGAGRIIFCTGAVMRPLVRRELGARLTAFQPRHKGRLSNEFACYTSYVSSDEGFRWVPDA